jgi:hypothetical protein
MEPWSAPRPALRDRAAQLLVVVVVVVVVVTA